MIQPGTRILLIDDEEAIIFAFSDYFKALGCQVDSAATVEGAKSCLSATEYDVAVIDLNLSGASNTEGLEIVYFIGEKHLNPLLIVQTAYGSTRLEEGAKKLGVHSFLNKPIPLPEMAGIIESLLKER